jgi:hypothetical protein
MKPAVHFLYNGCSIVGTYESIGQKELKDIYSMDLCLHCIVTGWCQVIK